MSIKVKFKRHGTFWLVCDGRKITARTDGALAPLSHCTKAGDVTAEAALFLESYAHLYETGDVKRHGEVIGTWRNLIPVKARITSGGRRGKKKI